MTASGRRAKRFLSAEQKYELWVRMLTGQLTTVRAAAEAGVDRTTIATLKRVARDGAIAALEASRPGRRHLLVGENVELARLRGEVDRLSGAVVEQAIELAALRGTVIHGRWRPPGPDEILDAPFATSGPTGAVAARGKV